MTTVNITEFKRNIGSYFDKLISTKEPLIVRRRNFKVKIEPIPNDDYMDEGYYKSIETSLNRVWEQDESKYSLDDLKK